MTYKNLSVKETPTIKLNIEKKMNLYPCDFKCSIGVSDYVDRIAKEVKDKETELINIMLAKCGITMNYISDNREKFLYVPHGNAKSLFYCNNLMFTIMTELLEEDREGYSKRFEHKIYVIEDNSDKIRELLWSTEDVT